MHSAPAFQLVADLDAALPSSLVIALVISVAACIRWMVALHSYSGLDTPPTFGDYEAQRHWMELTRHLPTSQWYSYSEDYWRLDYPPLTAYHSLAMGIVGNSWFPEGFALESSRGFESPAHKLFMRATVMISELLVYVPAVILFLRNFHSVNGPQPGQSLKTTALLFVLLQPGLILIDHGHFQYNSVMLGFSILSWHFMLRERYLVGSVCFCCALLFKQMALYYALPVFSYLLAQCLWRPNGRMLLVKLAATVILTFAVLLAPFWSMGQLAQIAARLFPFTRGLFEDKVANVWCALDVLVKLRKLFSPTTLLRISTAATFAACLPACLPLLFSQRSRSSMQVAFIYSLAASSLAFFLFSFQVHEKSILIPAMPITLLIIQEPTLVPWFSNIAVFSMAPLLHRDGCALATWTLLALCNLLFPSHLSIPSRRRRDVWSFATKNIVRTTYALAGMIQLASWMITPPARYPDLWIVANVFVAALVFSLTYVYLVWRIWQLAGWIETAGVSHAQEASATGNESEDSAYAQRDKMRRRTKAKRVGHNGHE